MKTIRISLFTLLIVLLNTACDKNEDTIIDNTPPLSVNEIEGTVTLPEGSTLDFNNLTVSSPVGTTTIENGAYRMDSLEDRFLTQLVGNANGDVYLMGYSYPGQTDFEINATSTALAMLMNMAPSLLMAPEGKQELIAKILSHNELQVLADQIDVLLSASQSPLSLEQTALAQKVAEIYNSVFIVSSKSYKKSDNESYPIDIRLINNEITFVNPGKSYETVVGIYKDEERIKKIEIDRVTFFPTTIGEAIGASVAAQSGEVPSGLEPVEYKYILENDGEYKIKVRTGDSDANDTETIEALLENYENWCIDLAIEIIPIGECVQPIIAGLKQHFQSFTTLPVATTQHEKLGLVYDILFTFLSESIPLVKCYLGGNDYKDYFIKLEKALKWLDLVGKIGNSANIWVSIMQIDNDEGAMDKCYTVEGTQVTECDEVDIYVAGYEYFGSKSVAAVWKNGVATYLTDGSDDARARSVYVSETNVYAAGYEEIGSFRVAIIWKNGIATMLTDGSDDAEASSVYVSGTDVYVAGYETIESTRVATVWKNGIATRLTLAGGSQSSFEYSIAISDNDIYVAGSKFQVYENNNVLVAKVWKNGVATSLTDGTEMASAHSIYVSGTDVYVAGSEGGVATIWKNGVATSLTISTNSVANSVYVSGSDVYVVGHEYNGTRFIATAWKNGVATYLTDGSQNATAYSVYALGNDVYISGFEDSENNQFAAKVWKNGIANSLTDGSDQALGFSIFVKEPE